MVNVQKVAVARKQAESAGAVLRKYGEKDSAQLTPQETLFQHSRQKL
jgi:hypothetical protein